MAKAHAQNCSEGPQAGSDVDEVHLFSRSPLPIRLREVLRGGQSASRTLFRRAKPDPDPHVGGHRQRAGPDGPGAVPGT